MNMDDFEKRMERQPLREIPGAWRREILHAARRAMPARPAVDDRPGWLAAVGARFSGTLNPWSRAWAGLGAVWVVIMALQYAARDREPALAGNQPPPTQAVAAFQQQRLLLSELAGQSESADASRARTVPVQPRSELRKQILIA